MKGLLKYAKFDRTLPIIKPGDDVFLAPAMYTGNADWRDSPLGVIPGPVFLFSAINMVKSGQFLKVQEIPHLPAMLCVMLFQYLLFHWRKSRSLIFSTVVAPLIFILGSALSFAYLSLSILWVPTVSFWFANGLFLSKVLFDARAKEDQVEEAEKDFIHQIQHNFLPKEINIPGMDIATYYQPAEYAGGDIYGIECSPNKKIVYLGMLDVTGHGLASAMMTGVIAGVFQVACNVAEERFQKPEDLLLGVAHDLNKVILRTGKGIKRSATAVIVAISLEENKGYYLNAGHCPIIRTEGGKLKNMLLPGSILGYSETPQFKVKEFSFMPGDQLVLYTDGLVENTNAKLELLSFKKWRALVAAMPSRQLLDILVTMAQDFFGEHPPEDDIAMLVARHTPEKNDAETP